MTPPRQQGGRSACQRSQNHPVLAARGEETAAHRQERDAINPQLKGLPGTAFQSARLMRDVKVATALYVLLLTSPESARS